MRPSVRNILEFQLLQLFMFRAASAPVLQLYAGGTCAVVSAATPAARRRVPTGYHPLSLPSFMRECLVC